MKKIFCLFFCLLVSGICFFAGIWYLTSDICFAQGPLLISEEEYTGVLKRAENAEKQSAEATKTKKKLERELQSVKTQLTSCTNTIDELKEKLQQAIASRDEASKSLQEVQELKQGLTSARQARDKALKSLSKTRRGAKRTKSILMEKLARKEKEVSKINQELTTLKKQLKDTEKFHRVKEGETLYSIAKKEYGDTNQWIEIYNANQDKIKMGIVTPGEVLLIPRKEWALGIRHWGTGH